MRDLPHTNQMLLKDCIWSPQNQIVNVHVPKIVLKIHERLPQIKLKHLQHLVLGLFKIMLGNTKRSLLKAYSNHPKIHCNSYHQRDTPPNLRFQMLTCPLALLVSARVDGALRSALSGHVRGLSAPCPRVLDTIQGEKRCALWLLAARPRLAPYTAPQPYPPPEFSSTTLITRRHTPKSRPLGKKLTKYTAVTVIEADPTSGS